MFDYEGCQDIERAWREGLTPDPLLTVSEWADRHRMLSTKASAEPGRWRTSRTPYLQAIMDCLSPTSPIERVVFMKGGQVGGPLALHTPVPLDGGWTTMEGIRMGDRVLDECGRPCRVTGVSKVLHPSHCYALRLDDGEHLICDGKHRWPVLDLVAGGARTLYTSEMRGRVRLPGRSRRYRYAIDARGLRESHQRRITEILEVDPEPLRCIEVGSLGHQYLCGKGYVPTHNTECGNNWIGYVIHHAPGPMMAVSPTVEMAKRNSKQRIDPLIEESPILRGLIAPHRSRDSGNTILAKEFRGGVLVMTGANSAVGLRSMPVRYLFLDEVDGYPGDVEGEGDALSLACARTRTFARRKIFIVSTPTIAGASSIEREFEASDQRRYFVPCPHCAHRQWLRFEQLRWTRGKPETASYICESCSAEIGEHHKGWMLEHGEWRAMAPEHAGKTAGFHLSSLYSPVGWRAWREIAAAWGSAQGSAAALKSFKNTELGETWIEEGEAPDWERLLERREDYRIGTVPAGGLLLTAGADVQKDRIEVSVWAFGRGKESWLVEHRVLVGDTARDAVWRRLAEMIAESWTHESGVLLTLARFALDTGYATQEAYAFVRGVKDPRVMAVKGVARGAALVGIPTAVDVTVGGKKLRRGVKVFAVASGIAKLELYNNLRKHIEVDEDGTVRYPAGYVHLPKVDAEYLKQLCAEQLVTHRNRNGFPVREWQKMRERNDALDAAVYARAAAAAAGLDRFEERHWRELERQLGVRSTAGETEHPARDLAPDGPASGTRTRPRRLIRSRWLGRHEP